MTFNSETRMTQHNLKSISGKKQRVIGCNCERMKINCGKESNSRSNIWSTDERINI